MNGQSDMNALIRGAAGRAPRLERDAPQHVGSIGVGRGAGSAPTRVQSSAEQINGRIRTAARIARVSTVAGGITLDTADAI